jgi:hypothetical protein
MNTAIVMTNPTVKLLYTAQGGKQMDMECCAIMTFIYFNSFLEDVLLCLETDWIPISGWINSFMQQHLPNTDQTGCCCWLILIRLIELICYALIAGECYQYITWPPLILHAFFWLYYCDRKWQELTVPRLHSSCLSILTDSTAKSD